MINKLFKSCFFTLGFQLPFFVPKCLIIKGFLPFKSIDSGVLVCVYVCLCVYVLLYAQVHLNPQKILSENIIKPNLLSSQQSGEYLPALANNSPVAEYPHLLA